MTKKRSAKLDKKAITKRILTLKLHGYGGACGSAAVIINEKVFDGKGKLVAVVNDYWLKRDRGIGHVAVKFGNTFWDSRGQLSRDDLLNWGNLDPEDSDYWRTATSNSSSTGAPTRSRRPTAGRRVRRP